MTAYQKKTTTEDMLKCVSENSPTNDTIPVQNTMNQNDKTNLTYLADVDTEYAID
jgi:hypothetical protein